MDISEPLGLWIGPAAPPETHSDVRAVAFEFNSRGDRACGRLLLPPTGDGPFPLVLLQHGANGSKDEPYIGWVGAPWARAGAAVATIDFPLHGARSSPKMTALLRAGLGLEGKPNATSRTIVAEFARQAVADLGRTLDAAEALPSVDASRIAYAGLSLGAIVGGTFLGSDARPCAAALALGGGGFGGPDLDPCAHVGRFSPRPLLFVNAERDEVVPRAAAEKLHAAAGEPKEVLWFDAGHVDLPGRAMKAMWTFLDRHLKA